MFYDVLWRSMTFYDVLLHTMTFYNLLWGSMTFDGVLLRSNFYDVLWRSMTSYDVLWRTMTFYNVLFIQPISDPREYCEAEEFAPRCSEDEVVVITEASYGRMELAHCVRMNYGEVGCRADVREHLDKECSGRRTCSLRIPDSSLDESNVCPREFKTYLNVSYDCIPGMNELIVSVN